MVSDARRAETGFDEPNQRGQRRRTAHPGKPNDHREATNTHGEASMLRPATHRVSLVHDELKPGRTGTDDRTRAIREPEPFEAFYRREFPNLLVLARALVGSGVRRGRSPGVADGGLPALPDRRDAAVPCRVRARRIAAVGRGGAIMSIHDHARRAGQDLRQLTSADVDAALEDLQRAVPLRRRARVAAATCAVVGVLCLSPARRDGCSQTPPGWFRRRTNPPSRTRPPQAA
jgi:hypothetical protein